MENKKVEPKRLRIFWNSNAMWTISGYGQQIAEILPHMRDAGYPIAICNFFGQIGGKFNLEGIMQYPVINHTYGSDAMFLHAQDFKADVVFTLQDTWVLNPSDLQQVPRWIPYLPVDHDPISIPVLNNLKFAYRAVSYSKFGQKELARNGIATNYIPHTVNTDIFTPMDKLQRKKDTGLPVDSFLVGMVAANKDNPPRKSFQEVMDAFKMFLEQEPKALLYIHAISEFPGGFPIKQYAQFIGIADKLLMPDSYQLNFNVGKAEMAKIYNAFDVLLMPSISEGFGIPAIEAQACGVPVIVNNFTSMPELVIPGITGEICRVGSKRFSPQGSYMAIPDTVSIFDSMMKIKNADRVQMGKAARDWVINNYDTKTVFKEKWLPYLEMLELEIYGPKPPVIAIDKGKPTAHNKK